MPGPGPVQQFDLVAAEPGAGRGAQQRLRSIEVVHQVGRGEHGPHPLQRLAHLDRVREALANLGRIGGAACAAGQRREERLLHQPAPGVVLADPPGRLGHDLSRLLHAEMQPLQLVADSQIASQGPAAVPHRAAQHSGHARVALDAADGLAVEARHSHRGAEQVGQHGLLHAGLPQRGQHLLDVGEEQAVGPHHQHALALQGEPVGVQQVGGPMQRHHGLAGAGASLHHHDARHLRADHPVLLALDGGHDVAETTSASRLQRGDQCARARPSVEAAIAGMAAGAVEVPVGQVEADGGLLAEELVLDPQQGAAPGCEVPPALQAERLAAGGPVEGLGHRCPPVHQDRVVIGVPQTDPSDVEPLTRSRRVDAAEHQRPVPDVELGQPGEGGFQHGLALESGLGGAAPTGAEH